MEEFLKNISSNDLEKLKMLFSIISGNETKEIVTLRVFVDEYSNLIKQNRSNTYHVSVMSSFKHLLEFYGSQKSIREIELKETENFCSYLQQKVHKGFYVYYRTLKAAFNKAKDWGYVKENYFIKVKLPKRQKLAPMFIINDQLSAICSQIKNEVIKNVFTFAFYTGMRLDEIINLRWKNVDLENCVITVGDENFTTKGRKQRFIPICEEALTSALSQKERKTKIFSIKSLNCTRDYVFCKANGDRYTGDHISQSFKRACKAAGLDNTIHFHSLRHSFASSLVQKGVPLYTIKELLGHSSIATTEIYSHLNMETLREAIKKLDCPHPDLLPKGEGVKQPQIFKINSAEK
ncbi:MAG: tyrosine-type recombinase/integrase [Bacteroidota bacterium]